MLNTYLDTKFLI